MKYFCCILLFLCYSTAFPQLVRQDHLIQNKAVKLHLREVKQSHDSSGQVLIMLHGGGPGATTSFDLPVEGGSLAGDLAIKGFRVYLLNIRGWEQSGLPAYDFSDSSLVIGSYQEAVSDIRAAEKWIRQREKIEKINLFGWATGGHWSAAYAIAYPENVANLISLNSLYGTHSPWPLRRYFAHPKDSSIFHKTAFFRESKQEDLTRSWTRSIPLEDKTQWRDPKVAVAYSKRASSFGQDTSVMKVPGGYREESFYMSLGKKYWDATDLRVPCLIIRTELDFWSRPEDLQTFHRDLPTDIRSRVITIPGTHYVFLDRMKYGRSILIEEITNFINAE